MTFDRRCYAWCFLGITLVPVAAGWILNPAPTPDRHGHAIVVAAQANLFEVDGPPDPEEPPRLPSPTASPVVTGGPGWTPQPIVHHLRDIPVFMPRPIIVRPPL